MKQTILFVTHKPKQCGVFEFGKQVFNVLASSSVFHFKKAECNSFDELSASIREHKPGVIIYNYHPSVMPWLCTKISKGLYLNHIARIPIPQVGIIHEVTQSIADAATAYRNRIITGPSQKRLNALFDFYIAPDPTLLLKNPYVFKTGRLIPVYVNRFEDDRVSIGSFGFATPNKGFVNLVNKVQDEFKEATIRINMPSADFGDPEGEQAKIIAEQCRNNINKPGIKLEITHQYFNDHQLLDFLAQNSLNAFLYEDKSGRGLSSAIDNAMAVDRPIAISRCPMFRHVLDSEPSICIEELSLKEILDNGVEPLHPFKKEWTADMLLWEYERILNSVLTKINNPVKFRMGIIRTFKSRLNRLFSLPDSSFTWLRNTDAVSEDKVNVNNTIAYNPIVHKHPAPFNRILDDNARNEYDAVIKHLYSLVPLTMDKKIARANIQQAFVFDTVFRLANGNKQTKMLCVGSYEDTASMALQKMGFKVDEIDPMINYYVQEFATKPGVLKNSYTIIFSTSVIEHDPDDKSFIESIYHLLAPGGFAIITCDYKDGWKPGDDKPEVDARFYTRHDMEVRLLSYLPGCELVGTHNWVCENPDFNYLGKYQYTFATFVFRKKENIS